MSRWRAKEPEEMAGRSGCSVALYIPSMQGAKLGPMARLIAGQGDRLQGSMNEPLAGAWRVESRPNWAMAAGNRMECSK